MRRPQRRRGAAKQTRLEEADEIRLLNEWIEAGKPLPGTKAPPPSKSAGAGPAPPAAGKHPEYSACTLFDELPLSQMTKDALRKEGFTKMSEIQRAALPHALCGRDVLGAAKTGSGKTLAFVIPVKLTLLLICHLKFGCWGRRRKNGPRTMNCDRNFNFISENSELFPVNCCLLHLHLACPIHHICMSIAPYSEV